MLGNFKFTDTSAGNFHSQVLVSPYTDLLIRGKYIPLTKNNEIGRVKISQEHSVSQKICETNANSRENCELHANSRKMFGL